MMLEPTPLQRFFQEHPTLCPPDYRFSRDSLATACPDFVKADPFYRTASLFIDLFDDLREQVYGLKILDCDANLLAKACIGLVNHDAISAFQAQTALPPPTTELGSRDFISVLANRSITTVSGAQLNLDESLPSLADTLQTILDALPHITRAPSGKNTENEPAEEELIKFSLLSNAYRIARGDWENALWLNFRLRENEDVLEQPNDATALAFRANYFRLQSHDFKKQIRRGKKLAATSRGAPNLYEAHLNSYSNLPAVKAILHVLGSSRLGKSVTLKDTFRIYFDLRATAEEILKSKLDIPLTLEQSTISRAKFISELAAKLNLTHAQLEAAIEILNYRDPRKSNIWTSPIRIADDRVLLILPALALSNPLRFLELTSIQHFIAV